MNVVELALARLARDAVIDVGGLHEHAALHDEVLIVELTTQDVEVRAVPRTNFNAQTGHTLRRATTTSGGLAAWVVALAGDVGARFVMSAWPLALGGAA